VIPFPGCLRIVCSRNLFFFLTPVFSLSAFDSFPKAPSEANLFRPPLVTFFFKLSFLFFSQEVFPAWRPRHEYFPSVHTFWGFRRDEPHFFLPKALPPCFFSFFATVLTFFGTSKLGALAFSPLKDKPALLLSRTLFLRGGFFCRTLPDVVCVVYHVLFLVFVSTIDQLPPFFLGPPLRYFFSFYLLLRRLLIRHDGGSFSLGLPDPNSTSPPCSRSLPFPVGSWFFECIPNVGDCVIFQRPHLSFFVHFS